MAKAYPDAAVSTLGEVITELAQDEDDNDPTLGCQHGWLSAYFRESLGTTFVCTSASVHSARTCCLSGPVRLAFATSASKPDEARCRRLNGVPLG